MRTQIKKSDLPGIRYEINELFTPSTPVRIADLFAGRRDQIMQAMDAIAEPGRHAVIYGERGVGKTSLAEILPLLIPTNNRTINSSIHSCTSGDNFTSIWRKFFRDITFEIEIDGEKQTASMDDIYSNEILPDDVIRTLSKFGQNDISVMIIDEFNEVRDQTSVNNLAHTIKAISDRGMANTIIVVGVGDSVTELFSEHESISRCCEEILMPRMSREELVEILEKRYRQLGLEIEPNAKWKIVILARGLPSYVHRLGRQAALLSVSNLRGKITDADVDFSIEEMVQGSLKSLRDGYEKATYSNQPGNLFKQVLLSCALARSVDDSGYFTPASVREPLSKIMKKTMQIAQYQSHLKNFTTEARGEILQRTGEAWGHRFRFRDPAMQPYALFRGAQDGLISEDIKKILHFPEQGDLFPTET